MFWLLPVIFSKSTDLQYNNVMNFLLAAKERTGTSEYEIPVRVFSWTSLRERDIRWITRLANAGFSFDMSSPFICHWSYVKDNARLIGSKCESCMGSDLNSCFVAD